MSDLIKREDAIKVVDSYIGTDPIVEELKKVPPAEPKQGEWIAYKGMQPPEFHGKHYCSNCYHAIHLASNGNVYNYCPNCGARMEDRE